MLTAELVLPTSNYPSGVSVPPPHENSTSTQQTGLTLIGVYVEGPNDTKGRVKWTKAHVKVFGKTPKLSAAS
jgi:hypothetical protein